LRYTSLILGRGRCCCLFALITFSIRGRKFGGHPTFTAYQETANLFSVS
jgi:hypothetical protein